MILQNSKQISFPYWAKPLLEPHRYKIIYGGRGSGKSFTVADFLLLKSMERVRGTILCGREFQSSIDKSVYKLLKERISFWGLDDQFRVYRNRIVCKFTKTEFVFIGLSRNIGNLKGLQNIIYAWIEEGAYITRATWDDFVPSIRATNSEIIVTFNPVNKSDVIYNSFIEKQPPDNSWVKKISFRDNLFFGDLLYTERKNALKLKTIDEYNHIWEGECLEHSDAQIFKGKWDVAKFEDPKGVHKYYGLDFGSTDPLAAICCYVFDNNLYISHEAYRRGVELDHMIKFLEERLPDLRTRTIYADNARPESISYLKRHGLKIKAVEKGKGSVEDGIAYIRSFNSVIIHEDCVNTIKEFTLYSYKEDPRSGDITNTIIDKHNHCIDALRYALERSMKKKKKDYAEWNLKALADLQR